MFVANHGMLCTLFHSDEAPVGEKVFLTQVDEDLAEETKAPVPVLV